MNAVLGTSPDRALGMLLQPTPTEAHPVPLRQLVMGQPRAPVQAETGDRRQSRSRVSPSSPEFMQLHGGVAAAA